MVSLPSPVLMTSLPEVPADVSAPLVPWVTFCTDTPVGTLTIKGVAEPPLGVKLVVYSV